MGPQRAAQIFLERNQEAKAFEVTLYGSLAATGKGHQTDRAIVEVLSPVAEVELLWEPTVFLPFHPNGMRFIAKGANGEALDDWTVYSVGGGALSEGKADSKENEPADVYDMSTMTEIMKWCYDNGRSYWEYVDITEGPEIWDYLMKVWKAMQAAVERGINTEGRLPGPLNLSRKASTYYVKASGYQLSLIHI